MSIEGKKPIVPRNEWEHWAIEHGAKMPVPRPLKSNEIPGGKLKHSFSVEEKEEFESLIDVSVVEHINKKKELPFWALGFASRHGKEPVILTDYRHKKLPGYYIEYDDEDYWQKLDRIRRSGAWVISANKDEVYTKLKDRSIWVVEKEFIRSRDKRMLAYRFLDCEGDPTDVITLSWAQNSDNKLIRHSSIDEIDKWQTQKESNIKFDNFPEKMKSRLSFKEWWPVDEGILSLV